MRLNNLLIGAVMLVLFLFTWYFAVVPGFETLEEDFHYEADIFSVDNFYDENKQEFFGEGISQTEFSYTVVSKKDHILEVKNIFDVKKISGEKIFTVERLYGIDEKTGMHVSGSGDKDRSGYLFGPKNADKKDYTYWHINYDDPAQMKFKEEEILFGLKTYKFEADYYSEPTFSLTHLPGVPEERGVGNDVNLKLWIEPKTGRMIKYEDDTEAYYFDIDTQEKLHPWNHFKNRFTKDSVKNQVLITQNILFKQTLIQVVIPLFMIVAVVIITLFISMRGERK